MLYVLFVIVKVLKFCLSFLSFIETHVSVTSPFPSSIFVYGTYTVCGVFCLRSSVVLLVLFLSLSLL